MGRKVQGSDKYERKFIEVCPAVCLMKSLTSKKVNITSSRAKPPLQDEFALIGAEYLKPVLRFEGLQPFHLCSLSMTLAPANGFSQVLKSLYIPFHTAVNVYNSGL